jgi:hypothetical protein
MTRTLRDPNARINRLRELLHGCRQRNAKLMEDMELSDCGKLRLRLSFMTEHLLTAHRQLDEARAEIAMLRGHQEAAE